MLPLAYSGVVAGESSGPAGFVAGMLVVAPMSIGTLIIAGLAFLSLRETTSELTIRNCQILLVFGIFAAMLGNTPWLDDDLFRYMWEGFVFGTPGIDSSTLPLENLPGFPETVFSLISYRSIPTVYPPGAQLLFAGCWKFFGESTQAWIIFFAAVTLATIFVWGKILAAFRAPSWFVILFLMNPLFVKEFADSAHVDIVGIFLISLGLLVGMKFQSKESGKISRTLVVASISVCVGMAASLKIFPVVFLLFWPGWGRILRMGSFSAVVIVLTFLFWIFFGGNDGLIFYGESLAYFGKNWVFNPGFTEVIKVMIDLLYPAPSESAWRLAASVSGMFAWVGLSAAVVWQLIRPKERFAVMIGFCWFLIFLPAVNSWYLFWLWPAMLMGITEITHKNKVWSALPFLTLPLVGISGYWYWIDLNDHSFTRRLFWLCWIVISIFCFWKHLKSNSKGNQDYCHEKLGGFE